VQSEAVSVVIRPVYEVNEILSLFDNQVIKLSFPFPPSLRHPRYTYDVVGQLLIVRMRMTQLVNIPIGRKDTPDLRPAPLTLEHGFGLFFSQRSHDGRSSKVVW
jgi:hypothetical protein